MSKRLYVAYGSNLNIAQMKHRCPTAKLYGTGTLEGYELQFKGYPSSAFATIAPKAGSSVPVAVWDIKPNDEKNAAQKNIGISTKMLFSRCSPLKNKFAALFINAALIRI